MILALRPASRRAVALLLLTAVILVQEMALIRWLPAQVRVLAYFPNLVLIAAFLGLGVGCLRAGRGSLLMLWPVSLLVLVTSATVAGRVAFTETAGAEHLWLLYFDLPEGAPEVAGVRAPILVAFVLTATAFVAPGQLLAERLAGFGRAGRPLTGYALDLAGSLAGVVVFTVLAWQGIFPVMWFALLLVGALPFFTGSRPVLLGYLLLAGAIAGTVQLGERAQYYSPYYALRVGEDPRIWLGSPVVLTNGSFHQAPAVVARQATPRHEMDYIARNSFHIPYELLQQPPRHALVLGAGTGNDVAVLLDRGAETVDAVEIDPVILRLGETLHPDRPYDSPRVRRINTDARSFLQSTDQRYDLVVFGTLDSLTRLSALSNVRLDNFVYTVEGLRAAYDRLAEGGGMVLYFSVSKPYIAEHLTRMLMLATGRVPFTVEVRHVLFNVVYMVGPAFDHLLPVGQSSAAEAAELTRLAEARDLPSDDWPFLYLERRGIGGLYLSVLAAIAAIAVLAVFAAAPAMRSGVRRGGRVDLEMFLYGFAFLLLETKFVTTINLLWGVTWIASAVVFAAILATMLLATLVAVVRPLPWRLAASGLVLSLLVAWTVPVSSLLHDSLTLKLLASALFVGVPVFLASTCFALRFRTRDDAGTAFGWNLLGAVFGGLTEFASMTLGLKALFLVALAAYLAAFLLRQRAVVVSSEVAREAG